MVHWKMERALIGDGTWFFNALTDGDDIVVRNVRGTWFGGDNDLNDNGETASGVMTRGNPDVLGCALPLKDLCSDTAGSPIPKLPYLKTTVRIFNHATKIVVEVPLIDLGPAKHCKAAIDLTQATFKKLGGKLEEGEMMVDYRILKGWEIANAGNTKKIV